MNNWITLKAGMLIRTKRDLQGFNRSWNRPQKTIIKENTVLLIPDQGTKYGQVGPLQIGEMVNGEFKEFPNATKDDFLAESHTTNAPNDLGFVNSQDFEIVGIVRGQKYQIFSRS